MDLVPWFLCLPFSSITLTVAAGACVYVGLSFGDALPWEPTHDPAMDSAYVT